MKTYYWLIKREFWENRGSLIWAPLITAGVFAFFHIVGLIRSAKIHLTGMSGSLDTMIQQANYGHPGLVGLGLDMSIYGITAMIYFVAGITLFFYCLGALYDDRNDRSYLFWKSLPISDRDTVLSKVASATVLTPVIATVIGIVAGMVLLFLTLVAAAFHGLHAWTLLGEAHPFQVMGTLIGAIPVNLVWMLPTVGWLMLCSAWARSKPFLWATVIPLGSGALLYWLDVLGVINFGSWFWHHVVARLFVGIVPWSWFPKSVDKSQFQGMNSPDQLPAAFHQVLNLPHAWAQLARPDFWIGAILGVVMILAAIWLRRWRTET